MTNEETRSPLDELIEKLKTEIPEEKFKELCNTSESFRELFEEDER